MPFPSCVSEHKNSTGIETVHFDISFCVTIHYITHTFTDKLLNKDVEQYVQIFQTVR